MVGNQSMYKYAIMLMNVAKDRLIWFTKLTDDSVGIININVNEGNRSEYNKCEEAILEEDE